MTSPTATASSTGLAPNVAGALAYLLGPITGILFFLLEKENRFVRYHAAQSITLGLLWIALSVLFSVLSGMLVMVPVLGWLVALLLSVVFGLGGLFLWLFLMWRAFQGREWESPIAGPMARKLAG
ncbi:MAG TPA: DUF4870 domain-containing protein [Gemmatimonadaceae bacterium]|nr:DUF4870 domain-containing protein [Gemmatimonadaceae bacterium]